MDDETKLKLYLQAHRDGSIGTQELDPLDVIMMVDSGHFEYLAASDRTYWNDLTITHEGRRELCRLRAEAEGTAETPEPLPQITELPERLPEHLMPGVFAEATFGGGEITDEQIADLCDGSEEPQKREHWHALNPGTINVAAVNGVNELGDHVRAMPFQEEPEPEPPVPEEHRPREFAVDLGRIVTEISADPDMDGLALQAWFGENPLTVHWSVNNHFDGGLSAKDHIESRLVEELEKAGLTMMVKHASEE